MIDDLIGLLSRETGLTTAGVRRIILTAPRRYKIYTIPKRSGGTRTIAHPARELKLLQRALLSCVIEDLPVHGAATAYRKGMGLKSNAAPHAENNGPILKLDFKDFFPSIRGKDWVSYAVENRIFQKSHDAELSALLMFRRSKVDPVLRLSVGAPTSPALSNVLLRDFDQKVWETAADRYVTYTRYADDMTFSAVRSGFLQGMLSAVASIVRETQHPKLQLNGDKTRFVTTKFHRDVTGLTLSLDGRVTIGQLRKRNIRAGIHQAKLGQLAPEQMQSLAGHIAFGEDIEPGFIDVLKSLHGSEIIDCLLDSARRIPDRS